ncbi:MAG TPA: multidrug efflux RND transporter permease subunit [Myxococcota bacterium]|nr:multidrug efflux RND transporter permease subunit [Myxococcota bacterium]
MLRSRRCGAADVSRFFIDRPIFAAVLSIVIVIVGAIAYPTLPVAQYPDVVPPSVVVRATYPGANAEVLASTVATPLEQEINGVEHMLYTSSQATNDGSLLLTVTFELGTDLDTAQVLVQNRVAVAEPRLPEEVRRIGITTRKSSPDLLMVVHMISPGDRRDQLYLSNYAFLRVRDVLARLDGVGDVNVLGAGEYSMRIWLDPEQIAARGLTAGDVLAALREQNVQVAAGSVGKAPAPAGTAFELPVDALGRLSDPAQFEAIVIHTGDDGRITRVGDVARVELGARDYAVNGWLDGERAVGMGIAQRPGSNALATAQRVRDAMAELSRDFPEGVDYRIAYDPTVFVQESIADVQRTLIEAIALVVAVVLLFLQSWRVSLIPLLAIPVSLVGTFAVLAALGFSLNMLSLFGLVLAIGIVVDDAIIVVENIERGLRDGLAPREAARRAMREVGSAVIASTVVMGAVFVPTAFLAGITGQFYRQFAVTIAVSTFLSLFVSLTLTPALSATLLRPHGAPPDRIDRLWSALFGRAFRAFERGFERLRERYAALVRRLVRRPAPVLAAFALLLVLTAALFQRVPSGFIPEQDKGYLIMSIQLPDGASLERTEQVTREAARMARETPGIAHAVAFVGFSGATRTNASNAAAIFATFAPFEERDAAGLRAPRILDDLRRRVATIEGGSVAVFGAPAVQGLGTAGGFKLYVQDRAGGSLEDLQRATDAIVAGASQDPALRGVFSTFRASAPKLHADVDRTRVEIMDVPLASVFEALQVYLGSAYVNDFNYLGRTYQVRAQADARFRADPTDIALLRTRSASGEMVPLGSLVDVEWTTGADRVVRYNQYPAAEVNGSAAPGESSGAAIAAFERLAERVLPRGYGFEWTDLAHQEIEAGGSAPFVFALCVLFVFLALAAQYESWSLPLAVILIVPLCLFSAMLGIWLRGLDNNVLTQIGFVVLVALAAKNAILIVEFARSEERRGLDRLSAAAQAAALRLRPILMTSLAFILGVVPLMIASGAGAEMRQALGTAVFAGMLGITVFGLLLTPVFFVVVRGMASRFEGRTSEVDAATGAHVAQ